MPAIRMNAYLPPGRRPNATPVLVVAKDTFLRKNLLSWSIIITQMAMRYNVRCEWGVRRKERGFTIRVCDRMMFVRHQKGIWVAVHSVEGVVVRVGSCVQSIQVVLPGFQVVR